MFENVVKDLLLGLKFYSLPNRNNRISTKVKIIVCILISHAFVNKHEHILKMSYLIIYISSS